MQNRFSLFLLICIKLNLYRISNTTTCFGFGTTPSSWIQNYKNILTLVREWERFQRKRFKTQFILTVIEEQLHSLSEIYWVGSFSNIETVIMALPTQNRQSRKNTVFHGLFLLFCVFPTTVNKNHWIPILFLIWSQTSRTTMQTSRHVPTFKSAEWG